MTGATLSETALQAWQVLLPSRQKTMQFATDCGVARRRLLSAWQGRRADLK
jgi:hypothetical protein